MRIALNLIPTQISNFLQDTSRILSLLEDLIQKESPSSSNEIFLLATPNITASFEQLRFASYQSSKIDHFLPVHFPSISGNSSCDETYHALQHVLALLEPDAVIDFIDDEFLSAHLDQKYYLSSANSSVIRCLAILSSESDTGDFELSDNRQIGSLISDYSFFLSENQKIHAAISNQFDASQNDHKSINKKPDFDESKVVDFKGTINIARSGLLMYQNPDSFEEKSERSHSRPKIAYVSPLPPDESGIAEYSAELLPYLAKFFDISLFSSRNPEDIVDDRLRPFNILPLQDLIPNKSQFQTVVYQLGNSPFHLDFSKLIQGFPGIIVVHDFFLGHFQLAEHQGYSNDFLSQLDASHGLKGLLSFTADRDQVIWKYPVNWNFIRESNGYIAHSDDHRKLLNTYYARGWLPNISVIPQLRKIEPVISSIQKTKFMQDLGLEEKEFVVATFGGVEPTRSIENIIQVLNRSFKQKVPLHLAIVGGCNQNYLSKIEEIIRQNDLANNVTVTGRISNEDYRKWLSISDLAIQLRKQSRGETSRAVLDCLAFGIPTIINSDGICNSEDSLATIKIPEDFSNDELAEAVQKLITNKKLRGELAAKARQVVKSLHTPEVIAEKYASVINAAIQNDERNFFPNDPKDSCTNTTQIAQVAAWNKKYRNRRRILIDVTTTNRFDLRSGIQRVVKNIIKECLLIDDPSLLIEPVYLENHRMKRAARFAEKILGLEGGALGPEKEIPVQPNDTLVMIDTGWGDTFEDYLVVFRKIRDYGGIIINIVHDILPIRFPGYFTNELPIIFEKWLSSILQESDLLIGVSEATADDVMAYIKEHPEIPTKNPEVKFYHHGADLNYSQEESNIRAEVLDIVLNKKITIFLSAGTIEPRKGHALELEAFEKIWKNINQPLYLVFAGRFGWNIDKLINKIEKFTKLETRFLHVDNPSDAELRLLYSKAKALVFASEGEGFGLPIVEAALHGVPSILTDIPVFHEIAHDGALYFKREDISTLVSAIEQASRFSDEEREIRASKVSVISWAESAKWLLNELGITIDNDAEKKLFKEKSSC